MKPAASYDEWREINVVELDEREYLEEDLKVLETLELEEKAQVFGINIFPSERRFDDPEFWNTTRDYRKVLTKAGFARTESLIIDARFAYWKRWVEVVTPVASLIISLIALIVAIIALSR
jgi:hypothetical protein